MLIRHLIVLEHIQYIVRHLPRLFTYPVKYNFSFAPQAIQLRCKTVFLFVFFRWRRPFALRSTSTAVCHFCRAINSLYLLPSVSHVKTQHIHLQQITSHVYKALPHAPQNRSFVVVAAVASLTKRTLCCVLDIVQYAQAADDITNKICQRKCQRESQFKYHCEI